MKEFLENIIKNIVEDPNAVVVTESSEGERINLTISVADADMGRVIGKDGKVINAIRMIMRVMAIRQNVRVRIDIEDNQPPANTQPQMPVPQTPPQAQPAPQQPAAPSAADFVGQPTQAPAQTTVIDNSEK